MLKEAVYHKLYSDYAYAISKEELVIKLRTKKNDIEKVRRGIDNHLRENSIVVFHDNFNSNSIIEESLDFTIEIATKKAFEFGEPEDCLR